MRTPSTAPSRSMRGTGLAKRITGPFGGPVGGLVGSLVGSLAAAWLLVALPASATDPVPQTRTLAMNVAKPASPLHASAPLGSLYRVEGERTPSGFDVPRFVSLKFGRVNARTGPSRNHSIAYQYRRRGLPLIVVAETEMWRKVRDVDGDEAWVRKPALSGERFALLTVRTAVRARPDADGATIARIDPNVLVRLDHCDAGDYCRIRTDNGVKGFAPRAALWGAQTMD
ncbi:SH3 domain-containing protein [uncultured Algimonas sp.]|uniref:SH3 domain-containing protein n=1 Tax=uncultured Algimonas sp. TaxID=1547920 RepID=UPI0026061D70|nr:SH3 domain-containing protein [uncultured Algimonas sp.]